MSSFSANSFQESSFLSMLVSPTTLAECFENRPTLTIPVEHLDEIVAGTYDNVQELEAGFAEGHYLHAFLPALEWWIDVSKALTVANVINLVNEEPFAAETKQDPGLVKLLNDALSIYAAALGEAPEFSGAYYRPMPATMEFLRRYRMYTRAVCAFAQQVWPNMDLGRLLEQE
jgi:hypothetical protein